MTDQNIIIMKTYAQRLGISDPDIIEKSVELLRLFNMKMCKGIVSEPVKMVISIDCATMLYNIEIGREDIIKLSGLNRKEYTRQKELFEKSLDLGKRLSLDEICAQLEITDVIKQDAHQLLNRYKKRKVFLEDINEAHYLAMAIYQSCRMRKLKINKIGPKLVKLSHLTNTMWKRLEEEWTTWIKDDTSVLNHTKLKTNTSESLLMDKDVEYKNGNYDNNEILENESEVQPYENWRDDIINRAMLELDKCRDNIKAYQK